MLELGSWRVRAARPKEENVSGSLESSRKLSRLQLGSRSPPFVGFEFCRFVGRPAGGLGRWLVWSGILILPSVLRLRVLQSAMSHPSTWPRTVFKSGSAPPLGQIMVKHAMDPAVCVFHDLFCGPAISDSMQAARCTEIHQDEGCTSPSASCLRPPKHEACHPPSLRI